MPDVILFFPKIRKVSTGYRSQGPPPIGLGYIASSCIQNGYSVRIVDLNNEDSSDKSILSIIKSEKPKYVGVSFVTEARFEAFNIFNITKKIDEDIVTVAGGPHPSLTPDDTLENIRSIDYIVRGEGEEIFIDLLRTLEAKLDVKGVAGISYRIGNEIVDNPTVGYIQDLDSIPFPIFPYLTRDNYQFSTEYLNRRLKTVPVLTSRGCPFKCNFCATTKVWGATWRHRSPQNILEEIKKRVDDYGIEALWFVDDNFNSNPRRMLEICHAIRESFPHLKWICNIRIDNLLEKHVKIMAESGCISVEFGAESGSQRILDEVIHKKIKVEKILEVDDWCSKYGIVTDAQFIVSHPTETIQEANQTVEILKKMKGRSTLQIMKIYPGTELETAAQKIGILGEGFSWATMKRGSSPFPSITGDVPIFIENLSKNEIMELMSVAWTDVRGLNTLDIVRKVILKISSPREFFTYCTIGFPIMFKKCFAKIKGNN